MQWRVIRILRRRAIKMGIRVRRRRLIVGRRTPWKTRRGWRRIRGNYLFGGRKYVGRVLYTRIMNTFTEILGKGTTSLRRRRDGKVLDIKDWVARFRRLRFLGHVSRIVVDPSGMALYTMMMQALTNASIVEGMARHGKRIDYCRSYVLGADGEWHIGIGRIPDEGTGLGFYFAPDGKRSFTGCNSTPITYIGPKPAYGVADIGVEVQPGMWVHAEKYNIKYPFPSVTEGVKVEPLVPEVPKGVKPKA